MKVAINGFGRIGRSVFRILNSRPGVDVVAINDIFDKEALTYLLKYDTVMGRFPEEVSLEGDILKTQSQTVKLIANKLKLAFNIEWVEEVVAGIGVEHAHVHLLPRRPDDGLPEVPSKPLEPKLSKEEMEELKEKIATFL